MTEEIVQALFIDRTVTLSEGEVVERSGLTAVELHALADAGALSVASTHEGRWSYSVECLTVARTASRLRDELALDDTHALAVVLRLTQRIAELQEQIAALRARKR
jgi:DNA-binding transcriptional MerR regulator